MQNRSMRSSEKASHAVHSCSPNQRKLNSIPWNTLTTSCCLGRNSCVDLDPPPPPPHDSTKYQSMPLVIRTAKCSSPTKCMCLLISFLQPKASRLKQCAWTPLLHVSIISCVMMLHTTSKTLNPQKYLAHNMEAEQQHRHVLEHNNNL